VNTLAKQTIALSGETLLIDPLIPMSGKVRVSRTAAIYRCPDPRAGNPSRPAVSWMRKTSFAEPPIDMILPTGDYELEVVSGETMDRPPGLMVKVPPWRRRNGERAAARRTAGAAATG